jgi:purine-binding chemotaxis protein CheW
VLNVGGHVVGAVVDAVSDVVELPSDQIRPAPPLGAQVDRGHLNGIATVRQGDAERMLILVDIERLMRGAGFDAAAPSRDYSG